LAGLRLPSLELAATDGTMVDLSKLNGRTVVYVYPRTGVPGQAPLVADWDQIPGARGCTPQSCSFRDHYAELKQLGVARIFGLSTQDSTYQREAVERLHLPFPVLSDERLALARAIRLPTFTAAGLTLHKRDRRRRDHQGVLSGLPAGQERRRGRGVVACCVARMRCRASSRDTDIRGPAYRHSASKTRVNALKAHAGYFEEPICRLTAANTS
jgi:peroxiredoxin